MATTTRSAGPRASLPGRRYDRQFFLVMVLLLLAVIVIGFADLRLTPWHGLTALNLRSLDTEYPTEIVFF